MSKDEIFRAALSLSEDARAELAGQLLESLDESDEDEEEIERLWALEAEDRIAAYERGEIEAIPVEEFLASLKSRGRNAT
ncbi:MAG TPA: addiction module protein [Thermoanaerobaculia bacterium]|jgi:putative addiction module component (TIGR02574 family)